MTTATHYLELGLDYCPLDQHERINVGAMRSYRLVQPEPFTLDTTTPLAFSVSDRSCSHDLREYAMQWDAGMGEVGHVSWRFAVCEHGPAPVLLHHEAQERIELDFRGDRGALTPYQRGFINSQFGQAWSERHSMTYGEIMERVFKEWNAKGVDITLDPQWGLSVTARLADQA